MWAFPLRLTNTEINERSSKEFQMATPKHTRSTHKLPINVDFLAIGIALTLAVLIRLGVIHQITF
jgi:hypothetical protein